MNDSLITPDGQIDLSFLPRQRVGSSLEPGTLGGWAPSTVAFLAFHAANPHVLDTLVREGLRWVDHNGGRVSIALLWERLRWVLVVETAGGSAPKLSNAHRAYYARLIEHREPALRDLFVTKRSAADVDQGWLEAAA